MSPVSRLTFQRAVEQPDWGGPYVPLPPLKPWERPPTLQTAQAQADYWRVRCAAADGALRSVRAELALAREARRAAEHARDSATRRATEATAELEALYRSGGPLLRARARLAMAGQLVLALCLLTVPVEAAQLTLSWVDNSANETSFRVDRAPSESGPWAPVGFAPLDAQSYVDQGLADGTTYCYRVLAVADNVESEPSNTACRAAPLPAPSGLTVVVNDTTLGRVVSKPAGIKCGHLSSSCAKLWPIGTRVLLSGIQSPGARLTAWTDACAGQAVTKACDLTITGPLVAGATFTRR